MSGRCTIRVVVRESSDSSWWIWNGYRKGLAKLATAGPDQSTDTAEPLPDPPESLRWADAKLRQDSLPVEIDPQARAGDVLDSVFRQVRPNGVGPDVGGGGLFSMGELESLTLTDLATLRELDEGRSLSEQGVVDGSTLGLLIGRKNTSRVFPCMISVPDPAFILEQAIAGGTKAISEYPAIWGVMLYTDEDAEVASYVRRYFSSLNVLSGTILRLLVIEKPDSWADAERYWNTQLSKDELDLCRTLGWLSTTPYDRSRVYEIARQLDVRDDQLPCFALVDTLGLQGRGLRQLQPADRIVFPIAEVTPRYFRGLFAAVKEAVGDVGAGPAAAGSSYDVAEDELLRAAENYQSVLERIRAAGEMTAAGTFNFYGRTVFINHPARDVHVADGAVEIAGAPGEGPDSD